MSSSGVTLSQSDTQISKDDQMRINKFSRFNMKAHELRREIKFVMEGIETLDDAAMLIEESFGEDLKLIIGECMIEVDEDLAN